MREKLIALVGFWSLRPPDFPAKVALGITAVLLLAAWMGRGRSLFGFGFGFGVSSDELRAETRRFVMIVSLIAALLSIAYVATYLRGGPRIVDATTYFLQGRALSRGHLAWTPMDPSSSFRGRFLLYNPDDPNGASLGGIFPPGYPLLLAFGFMLGSPMLVGPLIAAALVIATYKLAHAIATDAVEAGLLPAAIQEPIARAATLLSVFCAALRYHTADTMSHGASALGITVALAYALEARRSARLASASGSPGRADPNDPPSPFEGGRGAAILAGLAVGYVAATRPASALPIAIVVGWLLFRRSSAEEGGGGGEGGRGATKSLGMLALLAVVPGVLLLMLSQRAVTGSWLASTQRMYYATSDGPPGCFRWGFGKGTGCIFEHGDYVHARMANGYGVLEALGTTFRRLRRHLLDVANFEPLALLVLVPIVAMWRKKKRSVGLAAATAVVVLQILAYAPFYFDGDYPGGGARLFADVLPIEHVLVIIAVACLVFSSKARDKPDREIAFTRGVLVLLALATGGFAVHASHEHGLLRDRDGGHPMFEPDVLSRSSLATGLVFIDSDHGFALGHDPSVHSTKTGVVVARLRNDDRDRVLFDALDHPPTYLYRLDPPVAPSLEVTPTLVPWAPPDHGAWLKFEAEAEWPPLSQKDGFAAPGWTDVCASGKRALVLTPASKSGPAGVVLEVPVPTSGKYSVEIHLVEGAQIPFALGAGTGTTFGRVVLQNEIWTYKIGSKTAPSPCITLPPKDLLLTAPHARILLEAVGDPVGLDYVGLKKSQP